MRTGPVTGVCLGMMLHSNIRCHKATSDATLQHLQLHSNIWSHTATSGAT